MCGCNFPRLINNIEPQNSRQAAESVEERISPQLVGCPKCRNKVKPGFAWCPYCGTALQDHACRYCQQKVQTGEVICKYCGAPV